MSRHFYFCVFKFLLVFFVVFGVSEAKSGIWDKNTVLPETQLIVPVDECFTEDFSDITVGNNEGTSGSNSAWEGNDDFPSVEFAYKAGGAVKLGNASEPVLLNPVLWMRYRVIFRLF